MLVRKYQASTLDEVLAKVKHDLGPDALILSTQQKRKKWYQKGVIEVTAAFVDEPRPAAGVAVDEDSHRRIFPLRAEIREEPEESDSERRESIRKTSVSRYHDMAGLSPAVPSSKKTPAREQPAVAKVEYLDELLGLGFSEDSAKEIARRIIFDHSQAERRKPDVLRKIKTEVVSSGLQTVGPSLFDSRPRWAAIGVGGVGKTSLIVKLGLSLKRHGYDVRFSGCDQRKVMGWRELAAYSRLIGVACSTSVKFEGGHKRVHLIDTPAFTLDPFDDSDADLRRICADTNTFIVLDASVRFKELLRIVDKAACYSPSAIAFTKVDLVTQGGVIYEVLKHTRLPLLGLSLSASFRTPFAFMSSYELAERVIGVGQAAERAEKSQCMGAEPKKITVSHRDEAASQPFEHAFEAVGPARRASLGSIFSSGKSPSAAESADLQEVT